MALKKTLNELYKYLKKVKQFMHSPGQAVKFQEVEAPRFQDCWHMEVIRLSASCTGLIAGTHFC